MTDLFEIESYASFCYASVIFSSSSSLTSEDLKTCLTRPYWQLWSPPRPKQRRGVLCYRTVLTARCKTVHIEKIGGMIENIIKISGHFDKKKKIPKNKGQNQRGRDGTVASKCISVHTYTDCAFKIKAETGWGFKVSDVQWMQFKHQRCPSLKPLEIAVFSL